MNDKKKFSPLIGASALAMMLIASPAVGQTSHSADHGSANSTGKAGSDKGASSSTDNATSGKSSKVEDQDREFIEDISHANLAEIEVGKLALEKSQSAEVKKFAQMLIDEHTKSQKELQNLAKKKDVTVPKETDVQHKTIATALKALSGDAFDKQFISRVGVGDHERTLELLKKTESEAKDKDLKAYAAKAIKSVTKHLDHAKKMESKQ